jgi:O-antigen/teichoic acid export membrane protein
VEPEDLIDAEYSAPDLSRTRPVHWWKILAIRNGLLNAAANATTAATGALGSIVIVRTLTPETYGAFSYYLWLAGILWTIGTLAFPLALTKIISELRGRGQEQEAYALAQWVALTLFAVNLLLGAVLVVIAMHASSPQRMYLLIIAAILGPNALFAVFRSSLLGDERYAPAAITTIIASFLQLALIFYTYLAGWGAVGFLAAVLSPKVIQGIGLFVVFRRMVARVARSNTLRLPSSATLRTYLAFCIPATLTMPVSIFFDRSEVFFLDKFSGLDQVGFYNLAYTVFSMFLTLGGALMAGFYPAISRDYGASDWEPIQEKVHQAFLLASVYAVPLTFGGWATIDGLLALLYGSKMLPSVPVAQLLFVGLLPGVTANLLVATLSASGGIWLIATLVVVVSVINIVLDLLLIPQFGAVGGALSVTLSQAVYAALLLVAALRIYRVKFPGYTLARILVVGVLTTYLLPAVTQNVLTGIWGLGTSVVLASLVYATTMWKLGYFQSPTTHVATPRS